METKEPKQLKWGYTKIGHLPTLPVALGIGAVLAIAVAALRVLNNPPGPHRWVAVLILAVFLLGPLSALAGALLVDRSTMAGATRNPEISVEAQWGTKAAEFGFYTVIVACGLGSAFMAGSAYDMVSWTLLGVVGVGALAFVASYLVQRLR